MQSKFYRKGGILCSCFADKQKTGTKHVIIVDTTNSAGEFESEKRKKDGTTQKLKRPLSIQSYNYSMGGVDHSDAMIHPYDCTRRSMNWAIKLGLHLLQRLMFNSFVVYKNVEPDSSEDFYDFQKAVIQNLMKETGIGRRPLSVSNVQNQDMSGIHMPHRNQKTDGTIIYRRCKHCSTKGIRKETSFYYHGCERKPNLCAGCFEPFHN